MPTLTRILRVQIVRNAVERSVTTICYFWSVTNLATVALLASRVAIKIVAEDTSAKIPI
jgi:hypothetical protein